MSKPVRSGADQRSTAAERPGASNRDPLAEKSVHVRLHTLFVFVRPVSVGLQIRFALWLRRSG
jgi:hypothetical protein